MRRRSAAAAMARTRGATATPNATSGRSPPPHGAWEGVVYHFCRAEGSGRCLHVRQPLIEKSRPGPARRRDYTMSYDLHSAPFARTALTSRGDDVRVPAPAHGSCPGRETTGVRV
eukprot:scaffold46267_cov60-Phaeocystis_antarctica.AAC.3